MQDNHHILKIHHILLITQVFIAWSFSASAVGAELPDTISTIQPSIVAIGTYQNTRVPSTKFFGSGFVVGDGNTVVTNAHVIPPVLDVDHLEQIVVIVGTGNHHNRRKAKQVAMDLQHDLAILKFEGAPVSPLALGDSNPVRVGELYAFTGFPRGIGLGFYPETQQSLISAITPVVMPAPSSRQLTAKMIMRLKSPFDIFLLDGAIQPGSSGSPLYNRNTGKVIAVVSLSLANDTDAPVDNKLNGIPYATPSKYVTALLKTVKK